MNPNIQPTRTPLAVKRGTCTQVNLLGGTASPAFQKYRERMFHRHQPVTDEEAHCVEMIVAMQWGIKRALRWQEVYNAQQDGLLTGNPGVDSPIAETDGHRSLHRPMDCQMQIDRMDRTLARNRAQLRRLQRDRRLGLLGESGMVESYLEFLEDGCATVEAAVPDTEAATRSEPAALVSPPAAATLPGEPARDIPSPAVARPVGEPRMAVLAGGDARPTIVGPGEAAPQVERGGGKPTRLRPRLLGGFGARRIFDHASRV